MANKPFQPLGALPNAHAAAAMPWLVKGGIVTTPTEIDVSEPAGYQHYGDNPSGSGMITTYMAPNASGQFEVNTGHMVVDNSFSLNAIPVPATPTLVVNGTVGSTTYTYKVVARAGGLQAPSATRSATTGNATLSGTNSITITWIPVIGALAYDIYRTAGAATQGRIGFVSGNYNSNNVVNPTLTFTDTGLVADGSTAPTANTTGAVTGDLIVYGNVSAVALGTPIAPLVQPQGTIGSTTWTYKIVARAGSSQVPGGHSAAGSAGSTTTGIATMTATSYNLISWQPVVGATSYDVYRTVAGTSPSTTGLIGNTTGTTFADTALAGDSGTAPTTNTTGAVTSGGTTTAGATNYIATESGANNAIAGALAGVTLVPGLLVTVKLAHTLQAGANTFNLNAGGALAIVSHYNVANNIGTAYAATGVIDLLYDGTRWLDMSQ